MLRIETRGPRIKPTNAASPWLSTLQPTLMTPTPNVAGRPHTHTHTHTHIHTRVHTLRITKQEEKRLEITPQGQQSCSRRLSVCRRVCNVQKKHTSKSPCPFPKPQQMHGGVHTHTHTHTHNTL